MGKRLDKIGNVLGFIPKLCDDKTNDLQLFVCFFLIEEWDFQQLRL